LHTSLRATAAATALAIGATATVAAAVEVTPAQPPVVGRAAVASAEAPAPDQALALPAVTTAEVDPALLAATHSTQGSRPRSVVEVVELTVVGGELELVDARATVALERLPGSAREWIGALPPVRVVDARGTHEGWEVRWTLAEVSEGVAARRVRVDPHPPVVVAGLPEGLLDGPAGCGAARSCLLFGAKAGYGGGTYEAGGTVSLRLPPNVDVGQVVVDLSFSLSSAGPD
jgi:hypothetical protein